MRLRHPVVGEEMQRLLSDAHHKRATKYRSLLLKMTYTVVTQRRTWQKTYLPPPHTHTQRALSLPPIQTLWPVEQAVGEETQRLLRNAHHKRHTPPSPTHPHTLSLFLPYTVRPVERAVGQETQRLLRDAHHKITTMRQVNFFFFSQEQPLQPFH